MKTQKVIISEDEWRQVFFLTDEVIFPSLDAKVDLSEEEVDFINKTFGDFYICQALLYKKYFEYERYKK
jgi:hypothetical protein